MVNLHGHVPKGIISLDKSYKDISVVVDVPTNHTANDKRGTSVRNRPSSVIGCKPHHFEIAPKAAHFFFNAISSLLVSAKISNTLVMNTVSDTEEPWRARVGTLLATVVSAAGVAACADAVD